MARRKKCKYGRLKSPHGRRVCRRKPRRFGGRKVRRARRAGRTRRRARTCKYGFKKGTRRCRRTPRRKLRRSGGTRAQQEAAMWRAYRAGRL